MTSFLDGTMEAITNFTAAGSGACDIAHQALQALERTLQGETVSDAERDELLTAIPHLSAQIEDLRTKFKATPKHLDVGGIKAALGLR